MPSRRKSVEGTVYLLHFDAPFKHAKHYVGWTEGPVENRLNDHRSGNGARLLAVLKQAGIGFVLARTWAGTRTLERAIKNSRHVPRYCPLCERKGR